MNKEIWQTTDFDGRMEPGEPWRYCPLLVNATENATKILISREGQIEMAKVNAVVKTFIEWLSSHSDWVKPDAG